MTLTPAQNAIDTDQKETSTACSLPSCTFVLKQECLVQHVADFYAEYNIHANSKGYV